ARLVMTLERFNRVDEARALLEQLPEPAMVEDADLRGEVIEARAVMAARGKDPAHARALLEGLLGEPGAERRDTMAWFLLAKLCDKQGDAAACMEYLRLAHESQMKIAVQLVPELVEPSSNPMNIPITACASRISATGSPSQRPRSRTHRSSCSASRDLAPPCWIRCWMRIPAWPRWMSSRSSSA